jgi:hypothetical protein
MVCLDLLPLQCWWRGGLVIDRTVRLHVFCTIRSVQHDFEVLMKYAMQIGLEGETRSVDVNYRCQLA